MDETAGYFQCDPEALSALLKSSARSMPVHYDPRNLSCVFIKENQGKYLEIPYRNLSHPAITLEEQIRATGELRRAKHPREDEEAIFAAIESRRQLIAKARTKTKKARREAQKQAHALESTAKVANQRNLRIRTRYWESSNLIPWRFGMAEDLEHLLPDCRADALLSPQERIELVKFDRWVAYARADAVLTHLNSLLRYPLHDPCLACCTVCPVWARPRFCKSFSAIILPVSMK
jgi:hypothetical protein